MTDPRPILTRLGLQQYIEPFENEGFETWESVLDITESDLDALKVKLGHRRILQREIVSTRGIRIEQLSSLNSPSGAHTSPSLRQNTVDDTTDFTGSESGPRQKRRYRRHPKPDENAPERPPSAYVLFSNKIREDLKPLNLSFTEIAKRVGESWQVLSPEDKEPYDTQAAASKEKYNRDMVAYKMTDLFREYQRYLAEFRAKHGSHTDETNPRLEHELSNASSSSLGTGLETSRHGSNHHDHVRRRLEPMGSKVESFEAANFGTSGGVLSQAHLASSNLGPDARKASSPTIDESYHDQIQDNVFLGRLPQKLPRLVPSEASPLFPGSTMTSPPTLGSLPPRRNPTRSVDQIPRFLHNPSSHASDSSSSVTSSQSSGMTVATSLSINRGSEDDTKHSVVLPPLSSITGISREATPLDHQMGRMDPHGTTASGAVTYGPYRASQPSLTPLAGSLIDQVSQRTPNDHASTCSSRDSAGVESRHPPVDSLQTRRQIVKIDEDLDKSIRRDPLSVLADAAGSTDPQSRPSPKFPP